jgi:hypothetical protein
MAEAKNSFLASKMNKDLDDRLIPSNEYKDALNIAVSNSEDSDVGALENILQNTNVFPISSGTNVGYDTGKVIGYATDSSNDSIYLFWTNYTDTSSNKLNAHQSDQTGFNSAIIQYNAINSSFTKILVSGTFLNFSTTHPIHGVNIVEDLLFWTDNRNQPRKINVRTAAANPAGSVGTLGAYGVGNGYSAGVYNTTNQTGVGGSGLTVSITVNSYGGITSAQVVNSGTGYKVGDLVNVDGAGSGIQGVLYILTTDDYYRNEDDISVAKYAPYKPIDLYKDYTGTYKTTMKDVVSDKLPDGTTLNPDYNVDYAGDPNFLEDKFVRFSYRFKFEDGEFSIQAPFTQIAFIPKQDGSFLAGDEDKAYQSTIVSFMENKVNQISLVINLPESGNDLQKKYKIKELDILYKESDGIAIGVLDTISVDDIKSIANTSSVYEYSYQSRKPTRTLPQSQSTRVYDKTPVRALAQESSGNRIIYANYINKHTAPAHLDYEVTASQKFSDGVNDNNWSYIEYPEHTVKRNRNYQVGFVLSDRYGRQSDVILSKVTSNDGVGDGFGASSFYFPYKPSASSPSNVLQDIGNSIKIRLNERIQSLKSPLTADSFSATGEPGLYNEITNPTGWYSYKIVVKQNQQEYYNVYLPGFLEGDLNNAPSSITHSVLISDNINKVPRDLQEVGPLQDKYSSDEVLFPVVENYHTSNFNWNQAFYPGTKKYEVTTIASFADLNDLGGQAHGAIFENTEDPLIMRIGDNEGGLGAAYQHMQPTLSIAETAPFVSNIDIYYETSTTGLISELNTSVDANLGTPVSGLSSFYYSHWENQNPGGTGSGTGSSDSAFVTDTFQPTDSSNNLLSNTELLGFTVLDKLQRNRTNPNDPEFQMVAVGAGYRIKILKPFYYGIQADQEESYDFAMTFRNTDDNTTATVNGATTSESTFAVTLPAGNSDILVNQTAYNGSTLLGKVVFVDDTGLIVTLDNEVSLANGLTINFKAAARIITRQGSLTNESPYSTGVTYETPAYSTMEGLYATIAGVNGTFDTNKNTQDLIYAWDTNQSLFQGGFGQYTFSSIGTTRLITLINQSGGNVTLALTQTGQIHIYNGSFSFLSTFSLKVILTDAGGKQSMIVITFDDVIPGAFSNAFSTAFDI